ncbi:hypothetical protein EMMF5_003385 [Cystobasidiomycetes sp. EMM_F5]
MTTATSKAAYSQRSSGVKRLQAELRELSNPDPSIQAAPVADNLFDWHFTIRFADDEGAAEFAGGVYHGRILLPANYPFAPPDITLLTPNGRFELNKKICLTITGYHQESWQPAWGIRTALTALLSFFQTEAKGAIGGLDTSPSERKRLAVLSKEWCCPTCGVKNAELLPPPQETTTAETPTEPSDQPSDDTTDATPASSVETVKLSSMTMSEPTDESAAALCASPPQSRASAIPNISYHAPSPTPPTTASGSGTPVQLQDRMARAQGKQAQLKMVEMLTRGLNLKNDTSQCTDASGNQQPFSNANINSVADHSSSPAATAGLSTAPQVVSLASMGQAVPSQDETQSPVSLPRPTTTSMVLQTTASTPPVWLDGMIGLVLVAIASLLCRKML